MKTFENYKNENYIEYLTEKENICPICLNYMFINYELDDVNDDINMECNNCIFKKTSYFEGYELSKFDEKWEYIYNNLETPEEYKNKKTLEIYDVDKRCPFCGNNNKDKLEKIKTENFDDGYADYYVCKICNNITIYSYVEKYSQYKDTDNNVIISGQHFKNDNKYYNDDEYKELLKINKRKKLEQDLNKFNL